VAVDLVVLATGMVPSTAGDGPIPGLPVEYDEYGFALENRAAGVFVAGVAHRPADVVTSVRDATGAALKAIQTTSGRS
jgi:quinone-modifying oxidoreductase subunit QmoA